MFWDKFYVVVDSFASFTVAARADSFESIIRHKKDLEELFPIVDELHSLFEREKMLIQKRKITMQQQKTVMQKQKGDLKSIASLKKQYS